MAPTDPKSNPRRTTAEQSVSLLHRARGAARSARSQQQDRTDSSSDTSPPDPTSKPVSDSNSPSSLNPLAGKHSSGESSNAEKWFEKSNNTVANTSDVYSNDPPYFLRNPSSEEQVDGQPLPAHFLSPTDIASSLQLRTGLMQLGTDASSTEDFRSVIDDLTIENKKLKRRLRKYEKLSDSHLKDEKLFEVRVHGLPPDKKRELEETLRQFAVRLNTRGATDTGSSNVYLGVQPGPARHNTTSSMSSLLNTDSAYASLSASGRESSSGSSKNRRSAQSAHSRHQNIHTYLHHIPEGLLPSYNPQSMTEKAKKKLVVRRLEQIFAGKGAAISGHQQAEQQQDVSNSAARADRIELEAQGRSSSKEGIREAKIMFETGGTGAASRSHGQRVNAPSSVAVNQQATPTSQAHDGVDTAGTQSPNRRHLEQRPTRPLDLDPHRAQVPAENMRYMRHLGFTMRDPGAGSPEDDEGWIYLNLLVSMAQLHTISVSSEFVRKAIDEFSHKLEMSDDGRKVRWKGGTSLTRTSSTGGESMYRTDADSSQSPRKRVKLDAEPSGESSRSRRVHVSKTQQSESSRFAYSPMFFHKDSATDDETVSEFEEYEDNGSSPFPRQVGGDSSGMASSGIRTTVLKQQHQKKKHNDGPIVFYNNARFCTDLSGDARSALGPGVPLYNATSVLPIGASPLSTGESFLEKRGPLATTSAPLVATKLSNNSDGESMELDIHSKSAASLPDSANQSPLNLEVTGIGGVYPADNFVIAVESRHVILPDTAQSSVSQARRKKVFPPRLAKLLKKDEVASNRALTKITSRRRDLQPSALPPALNYMDGESDSGSDDGSEQSDDMSTSPESLHGMPSLAAPQQMDMTYDYKDESDEDMEYDDDDDDDEADVDDDAGSDGSLDLLAAARQFDPEAVRAREREYDANMAERLAEEIPAGSSAATAGGGSGFASPASGQSRAAYRKAKQEHRAHLEQALRKHRAAGSTAVKTEGSSSEKDEDSDAAS